MKYKKCLQNFGVKTFERSGRTHKDIIKNDGGQMGHGICGLQSVMNRDHGRAAVKNENEPWGFYNTLGSSVLHKQISASQKKYFFHGISELVGYF